MAIVSVSEYRCSFPSRTHVALIITSHLRDCKRSSFQSQCEHFATLNGLTCQFIYLFILVVFSRGLFLNILSLSVGFQNDWEIFFLPGIPACCLSRSCISARVSRVCNRVNHSPLLLHTLRQSASSSNEHSLPKNLDEGMEHFESTRLNSTRLSHLECSNSTNWR